MSNTHNTPHVLPLHIYFGVFFALLVLTVVTVGVSLLALPAPFAIIVAMIVAFIKAALVVMFFMHLLYDDRFFTFSFIGSILFVLLFFAFTLVDISSRGLILSEQDNGILQKYEGKSAK